jgi:glycosyltransferase involved in cell wall biosynthesis
MRSWAALGNRVNGTVVPVSPPPTPVAVVIPTRDRHAVVQRAVRSAQAQTHAPAEIVVVDDGSDPPLALPPALMGGGQVKVVRLHPSVGAAGARNAGAARSSAPLIAFLDDDDEWRPEKLALQVAVLDGLPSGVAAVDCGYELCDPPRPTRRIVPDPGRDLPSTLLRRPGLLPSSLVVRRSAFDDLGGFCEDGARRTEDWEFALRLTDRFAVATVPQVLVRWNRSSPPPALVLDCYRAFVARSLEPRLAALDPATATRLRAWHRLVEGVYLAQAGRRSQARRVLWRAWRADPRSPRPLLQLGRTVLGERAWGSIRTLAARR